MKKKSFKFLFINDANPVLSLYIIFILPMCGAIAWQTPYQFLAFIIFCAVPFKIDRQKKKLLLLLLSFFLIIYNAYPVYKIYKNGINTTGVVSRFVEWRDSDVLPNPKHKARNQIYHQEITYKNQRNLDVVFLDINSILSRDSQLGDVVKVKYIPNCFGECALKDRGIWNWLTSILWGVVFLILLKNMHSKRSSKSKFEALSGLGYAEEKIIRDIPVIENRKLISLEKGECNKYSFESVSKNAEDWKLLQRFPTDVKQDLDNGYILLPSSIESYDKICKKLEPIVAKFDFDFFEFERNGNEISIYCDNLDEDDAKDLKNLFLKIGV